MSGFGLYLPMALPSVANLREHRSRKAQRTAAQRGCVAVSLRQMLGAPPPLPLAVTLTRISPKRLDDDNWTAAAKACRDGVADWLGIDDREPRCQWRYEQQRGAPREQALLVEVEPGQEPEPETVRRAAFLEALGRAARVPGQSYPSRTRNRVQGALTGQRRASTSRTQARRAP